MNTLSKNPPKPIEVEKIRPNDYNPNKVPDHIFAQLLKDVDRIGIQQPVLVRPDPVDPNKFIIIDGEHRWKASKELGATDVLCTLVEVSEIEAMVMTISMNKLRGEFDSYKLGGVIKSLLNHYTEDEIEYLLGYTKTDILALQELSTFDFESIDDEHDEKAKEILAQFDEEMSKTDPVFGDEFRVSVTPYELLIIETLLDAECQEKESKGNALARLLGGVLHINNKVLWDEVQERAKERDKELLGVD